MSSYVENFAAKMDWGKPFQRTGKLPLDRSSIFDSYADAVLYASGVPDSDSRKLAASSYVGQIITVYENSTVTVYKIEEDRSLVEVGRATEGDGKSITLDNGILSLFGFDTATEGQQPRIVNKGTKEAPVLELEWYTPDNSTVTGLADAVGALQTTTTNIGNDVNELKQVVGHAANAEEGTVATGLVKEVADLSANKANKSDVYTKGEIDGKLTGALHYMGTYESFEALSADVADGKITPAAGHVYNITTAGGTDADGVNINAGDNVIYNGTGWDVSSGTVDLSGYYTSAQIDTKLNDYYTSSQVDTKLGEKVSKEDGKRLMTNAEGARLAEVTKVEASETNGNVKIDGNETTVYSLPTANADTVGGVKSSSEKDAVAVGADGTMTLNKVSGSKVEGVVSEAAKVTNKLSIAGKTYDGSTAVEVTAADIIPNPDTLVHSTDIATEATAGLVKASGVNNGVSVGADGSMTVNDIDASKVKGVVSEAAKVTNKLSIAGKTYDGSTAVEVTAADIIPNPDTLVHSTDIATSTNTGVVKSSSEKDAVAVGTDGTMTLNKVSGSKVEGAVAEATNASKLGNVQATDILVDGGNGQVKSAAKLATAQNITLSGDATGSASFDGSAEANIQVTLKDVGTAATYTKVTTDSKGRVVSGSSLEAADIPELTLSKITDAGALAAKSIVARTDLDSTVTDELDNLNTKAHTHDNKSTLDGITPADVTGWREAAYKIDSKANSATTLAGYGITDAYTKTEVDGKVAGAYHFMGSYASLDALKADVTNGTITPKAGHVYNITTVGGTDMNGNEVHAGDNVAYVEGEPSGWDVLGGTMDLSAYAKTENVNSALNEKADKTTVNDIDNRVGKLESKVGNDTEGLVKTVADHTTRLTTAEQNVAGLISKVGDENSGLVQAVNTLNANAETTGSVRQLIAASASELNNTITEITKDGGTIDTKTAKAVSDHNSANDAHSDLFAAKQNKIIYETITLNPTDFAETSEQLGSGEFNGYVTNYHISSLKSGVDYIPAVTPSVGSCAPVIAAQFYPVAECLDTNLIVRCVNKPAQPITLHCAFTEI